MTRFLGREWESDLLPVEATLVRLHDHSRSQLDPAVLYLPTRLRFEPVLATPSRWPLQRMQVGESRALLLGVSL